MKINLRKPAAALLSLIMLLSLVSCGSSSDNKGGEDIPAEAEQSEAVATADEMTDVDEVGWEGMTPVTADQLNEGTYDINVESSSSMFSVEDCVLTAADGKLGAVMTMGGTGYRYIAMMSAEDAAEADETAYIYPEEDSEGRHTFTVDVEALDKAVKCAAFSDNKEKWYDRTLVFSSLRLPADAFRDGVLVTPASLGLADGEYSADAALSGGSGRASVDSPAPVTVSAGSCTALITWSSPHYDYMLIDGEKYLPVNTEGNSQFEIPVKYFDRPMAVTADTTAMSEPHEIEYILTFSAPTAAE